MADGTEGTARMLTANSISFLTVAFNIRALMEAGKISLGDYYRFFQLPEKQQASIGRYTNQLSLGGRG